MRAYRSPLKLFVFGIIGIVLMVAAADVIFGHWLSTAPDNTDGALSTRGYAQQRGDLVWGGAMLVAGIVLFGGAVTELIRRKPAVIVKADGLLVDTGGGSDLIPWEDVEEVSSGVVPDPYDGSMRDQLIVELTPDALLEKNVDHLTRVGDAVFIDAQDWSSRVTELALAAQGSHDHFRRVETLRTYEPPSVVWETTVHHLDDDGVPTVEQPDPVSGEDEE